MKPMVALGVAATWARLAVAFVAGVVTVGIVTAVVTGPAAIWVSVVAAAVVAAAIVLTWRQEHFLTLVARRLRPTVSNPLAVARAADHQAHWPKVPVAVRRSGQELVAVVAVDGPSHSPSVLDHHRVQSVATLPLGVVAAALRQFDVALAGIDVLSVGRRRAPDGHHHQSATYSRQVGDHAAMGSRRTCCVLRMNAGDNLDAVLYRESPAATLAACAQRLAAELTARQCPARVVDTAELADLDGLLSSGVGEPALALWGGLRHDGGTVTTYWVSPHDITSETLDRVWVPDCDYTATAVQLRPGEDGAAEIGMLVRYATGGPLREPPVIGLNPLTGRHDLGLRASLADAATPALRVPFRTFATDEDVRAPIGATGVIIGTTPGGLPLLVNLAAAAPISTSTVTVAGEAALLIQLAVNHAAVGYQVLVRSSRPDHWRHAAGAGLHIVQGLPPALPNGGAGIMVVYDDERAGPARSAAGPQAAITVRAVPARTASVADVHLEQDSPSTAVIRTAAFTYRVNIDLSSERDLMRTLPSGRVA